MGDFFTSPYERESTNMYEMARRGDVIGGSLIKEGYNQGRNAIQTATSNRISRVAGDTLSQVTSMGGTPGSGMITGLQERGIQPLLASEQTALGQLSADEAIQLAHMLGNQMSVGLSGLSRSSTAGDILGGITTLANIGLGGYNLFSGIGLGSKPSKSKATASIAPAGWGDLGIGGPSDTFRF